MRSAATDPNDQARGDGRWRGRVVTVVLLVALVGVVATDSEAWPLSSFRLFSGTRSGELVGWDLVVIGADGREQPVDLGADPVNARSALHELPSLPSLSPAGRVAEVRAWLRLAGMDGERYSSARLYRVVRQVPTDDGPARELRRTLRIEVSL